MDGTLLRSRCAVAQGGEEAPSPHKCSTWPSRALAFILTQIVTLTLT